MVLLGTQLKTLYPTRYLQLSIVQFTGYRSNCIFPAVDFVEPEQILTRLARCERGTIELGEVCHEYNLAYAEYKDNQRGRIADEILVDKSWERVKSCFLRSAAASAVKAKPAHDGGLRRHRRHHPCRSQKKIGQKKLTMRRCKRITSGLYRCPSKITN